MENKKKIGSISLINFINFLTHNSFYKSRSNDPIVQKSYGVANWVSFKDPMQISVVNWN